MATNREKIERVMLYVTGLGLIGLLSYTFWHTGGLLSRWIRPGFLGYTAAFGAEVIIVMLSYKLAQQKSFNQISGFVRFSLITALAVSAVANYYEGFWTFYGEQPTLESIKQHFDIVQLTVSILATGMLSLLVFAVSEIISSDVSVASEQIEQPSEQIEQPSEQGDHLIDQDDGSDQNSEQDEQDFETNRTESNDGYLGPEPPAQQEVKKGEQANRTPAEERVHQAIVRLVEQGFDLTDRTIAGEAGVAVSTANKYRQTYNNNGHNQIIREISG